MIVNAETPQQSSRSAAKLDLSLKEIPQAVTVVTRQRMDDQQLNSVQAVLENTTGISARAYDSERVSFFSRGFQIDSIQFDGIPTTYVNGTTFLDTAFYERVEVVRGATGLTTGAGNPSASINLVRKRPSLENSFGSSVSVGSWQNYRATADVSRALNESGTLRFRLVGVYQTRNSYLDGYTQDKHALYGIVEAALSPSTVASIGFEYQNLWPRGITWAGLPLWFADGSATHWAVSKSPSANWARYDNQPKSAFADVRHDFANGWNARAVVNSQRIASQARYFSIDGYPDATTGAGMATTALAQNTRTRQTSVDLMLSGPFQLLGRWHEAVIGLMQSSRTVNDRSTGYVYPGTAIKNIYSWDGNYPEPDWNAIGYAPTNSSVKQQGAYGVARLALSDRTSLMVGGRFNNYRLDQWTPTTTVHNQVSGKFVPYTGLTYNLGRDYALYGSYTEIFNPQNYRNQAGIMLDPTEGKNLEAGIKAELFNKRLNASLAVFNSKLDNVAQADTGKRLSDGTQAYYAAHGTESKGIELDLQGSINQRWSIASGIAHFTAFDAKGARLNTTLPRTTARLFSTYRLGGEWNRMTLGGGLNWQSASYQTSASPSGNVRVTQNPYLLATLNARYQLSANSSLALNVNNAGNKRYTVMSGFYGQVLYGEPRSLKLSYYYQM